MVHPHRTADDTRALLARGREAAQGSVIKTIAPGQAGAKRWDREFGAALLCVRYREVGATGKRYTTVEIVVDERHLPSGAPDTLADSPALHEGDARALMHRTPGVQGLRIHAHERELRQCVKNVGGRWDPVKYLWYLDHAQIQALGLQSRVVPNA